MTLTGVERSRRYRASHLDSARARDHAYYLANRERILERAKRYHAEHLPERAAYRRAYNAAHPGVNAKFARRFHEANPGYRRARGLSKYGLTVEQYDAMLAAQGGVCAICVYSPLTGKPLHVDHDHRTNKVRGLLCGNCNTALGMFEDDPETLTSAIAYLKEHA